jgi:exonuclease SbcC
VEDKITKKKEELVATKEEVADNAKIIQQWKSKLKRISKRIANNRRKYRKGEEDLIYLDEVVKGFSKTGIPNVIISRALHLLEERTNNYLDLLTSGTMGIRLSGFSTTKKGAVRNKIGIDVISATGVFAYESYSGGERQRLNIAMLLALRDVAQANKGVSLNCLWLDEVLDLSLDQEGISDVLTLLQHKKKDTESIFIISPKEELIRNSSGNFNNVLKAQKEHGFSKIIGG